MRARVRLGVLWVLAVALISAALAATYFYGVMLQANLQDQQASVSDQSGWRWMNALILVASPLLTSGLLVALVALVVHAVLWHRRQATPDTPSP